MSVVYLPPGSREALRPVIGGWEETMLQTCLQGEGATFARSDHSASFRPIDRGGFLLFRGIALPRPGGKQRVPAGEFHPGRGRDAMASLDRRMLCRKSEENHPAIALRKPLRASARHCWRRLPCRRVLSCVRWIRRATRRPWRRDGPGTCAEILPARRTMPGAAWGLAYSWTGGWSAALPPIPSMTRVWKSRLTLTGIFAAGPGLCSRCRADSRMPPAGMVSKLGRP